MGFNLRQLSMPKAELIQKKCLLISIDKSFGFIKKQYFNECFYLNDKFSIRIDGYRYYCMNNQPYYYKGESVLVMDLSMEKEACAKVIHSLIENRNKSINEYEKWIRKQREDIEKLKKLTTA